MTTITMDYDHLLARVVDDMVTQFEGRGIDMTPDRIEKCRTNVEMMARHAGLKEAWDSGIFTVLPDDDARVRVAGRGLNDTLVALKEQGKIRAADPNDTL